MSKAALRRRAKEARHWLFEASFPLWSERGVGEAGLFREALSLDHTSIPEEITRVRVQARQTYVFAQAALLGWKPDTSRDFVDAGVRVLSGLARRDDGLVGRTLKTDGSGYADDTPDLYDLAFVLYALAVSSQAIEGGGGAIASARALLDALDGRMKDRTNGGYAEALPPPGQRNQNPHMHLLEACLALHRADPDGGHLARATEIVSLFHEKFTAGPGGLLGEFFAPDWSEGAGDAARIVEPGHQFEWVWLLAEHARATGEPIPPIAGRLYSFATGTLDPEGRALLEVMRDGTPYNSGRRTWPQTEALKAHLSMLELTDDESIAAAACQSFDILMDEYLTPEGGWIDQYDGDGHIVSTNMPASTGYHVVLAFSELIRVMDA
jgi:mannose/cellobiose epimerase-like protein (N-acyl-D-glucosamine 2-epimerase family)